MYESFERPRLSVRLFRFFALLLVASQACLLLKDLASWPRMLGTYLLLSVEGSFVGRTRLRPWARLLVAAISPFVLRAAAFGIFSAAGFLFPGPQADALFPAFDETFFPLLPLWWWTVAAADNTERAPGFAALEAGLDLAFIAALFWSQGGFHVTLYPHPSLLAAAAGAALLLSLAVLAFRQPRSPGRSSGIVVRMGGFVLALVLILLGILGRYSDAAAARGGGLLKPTLFRFDLARYLKLETEISLSDDLVLIVRKDPVDTNVLLRRFILPRYDRRGIFRPEPEGRQAPESVPGGAREWTVPPWEGRERLEQEYWIVGLDPGALLAVDAPVSIVPYRLEAGSSFSSAYSLVSSAAAASLPMLLEGFDPEAVPAGFGMGAEEREEYTRWGDDPRVRSLALEISAEAGTYYETASAVLSYLRENYYYSLKPGAAQDGNQLAHFLFRGKKGYCSYFAFSMTLLLRSLGIPARVAAGFFVDPDSEVLGYHPVRADMAHAWTEVWFGQYGWVAFDPTSRTPAPGERFEESRGTDPALLERLLREILRGAPKAAEMADGAARVAPSARELLGSAALWILRRAWLLLPALYVALILAARSVRVLSTRRLGKGRRRILAAWDALESSLAAAGMRRPRGESVPDFADRLDRERPESRGAGFGALAREWENAIFGPGGEPERTDALLEGLERKTRETLRRTPILRRVLAFLDIRAAFRPLPGGRKR